MLGNYPKLISTHVDPSLTTTNFRYSRWIFILICLPKLVLTKSISHTLITCTHHSRDCIRDDSCFQSNIYNASNMSLCYDPCCYDKILVNHSLIFHYHGLNVHYEATTLQGWLNEGWMALSVGVSAYQSVCLSAISFFYLFVCLNVCVCTCLWLAVFHCLSVYIIVSLSVWNTTTLHSRPSSSC